MEDMSWIPRLVYYVGIFDAGVIMLGGLVMTVLIICGYEIRKFWERIGPALLCLILSNLAAAIVLVATRYMAS